jgi:hypothetical protein
MNLQAKANEFKQQLTQMVVDDLKEAMVDLWEAYPRVDMLHRWSSRWKVTAEDVHGKIFDHKYMARTELTDSEGKDMFLYVWVDRDNDVYWQVVEDTGVLNHG